MCMCFPMVFTNVLCWSSKEKRGGEFLENRKKTNRGGECSWWCDWSVSQIFLIFFYKNTNETLKSLFSGKVSDNITFMFMFWW